MRISWSFLLPEVFGRSLHGLEGSQRWMLLQIPVILHIVLQEAVMRGSEDYIFSQTEFESLQH
ncbi:MAG: hypothetical protein ACMUIA_05740 [bacterium]